MADFPQVGFHKLLVNALRFLVGERTSARETWLLLSEQLWLLLGNPYQEKRIMPKVVLFIATSLDGYIARSDGTVDWLFHDDDYGYTDFMNSLDTVVMGLKTWVQAKSFEDIPFAGKQVFVFSYSQSNSTETRIRFVQGPPTTVISEIRRNSQKDIWLVGGGQLIQQFIANNLVDEFRLFVHPIILGQGIPLFTQQSKQTDLSFVSSKPFSSGLVELRYQYHANKSPQEDLSQP